MLRLTGEAPAQQVGTIDPTPAQGNQYTSNPVALRAVVVGSMAAVALFATGCGFGGDNETEHGNKVSADTAQKVNENCNTAPNLSANRANTVYGSPEALFPSLKTVNAGKDQLLETSAAISEVQKQLTSDKRVLAVFKSYFMDTRANKQLPDGATLERAQKLIETYNNNDEVAAQDAAAACAAVEFLVPTTKFAVTRGQAVEVQGDHSDSQLVNIHTEEVNATDNLSGFELGFNRDDASLSESQKAINDKLQYLMLITKDGTIVINQLIGPGSIGLTKAHTKGGGEANTDSKGKTKSTGGGGKVSPGPRSEKNPGPDTGDNTKGKRGPNPNGPSEDKPGKDNTPSGGGKTPPKNTPPSNTPPETTPPNNTPPEQTPPPEDNKGSEPDSGPGQTECNQYTPC